jgi:hypothetical protein
MRFLFPTGRSPNCQRTARVEQSMGLILPVLEPDLCHLRKDLDSLNFAGFRVIGRVLKKIHIC